MYRVLKTCLFWLLMAALPIQGFAAAAMASGCAPAHHDGLATAVAEAHHDGIAAHRHDGPVSGHPASDCVAQASHSSDTPHPDQDSSGSTCAACRVGASAPPSSSPLVPAYSSPESFVVSQPTPVADFIPAGLKRPPKTYFEQLAPPMRTQNSALAAWRRVISKPA